MDETLYLLSNHVNAAKIYESIEQAKKGIFVEVNLDDMLEEAEKCSSYAKPS